MIQLLMLFFFCCASTRAQQTVVPLPPGQAGSFTGQQALAIVGENVFTANVAGQVSRYNWKTGDLTSFPVSTTESAWVQGMCSSKDWVAVLWAKNFSRVGSVTTAGISRITFLNETGVRQTVKLGSEVSPTTFIATGCAVRSDGTVLVASRWKGDPPYPKVLVIRGNIAGGFQLGETLLSGPEGVFGMACSSSDKCYILTAVQTALENGPVLKGAKLLVMEGNAIQKTLDMPASVIASLTISPDEKRLYTDVGRTVMNIATDEIMESPRIIGNPLVFSGDPALIYQVNGVQVAWTDSETGKMVGQLRLSQPAVDMQAVRLQESDLLAILFADKLVLQKQARSPFAHRVVDGASFVQSPTPGNWATMFGRSLSFQTATSQPDTSDYPILQLDTARVQLQYSGKTAFAQLYYASPNQINFFVPADVPTGAGTLKVTPQTVDSDGNWTSGNTLTVDVAAYSPGIYAITDPQGRVITNANGAAPGSVLTLWAGGLGPVQLGQYGLMWTVTMPTVAIGGVPADVLFSGLAPGFAGLYQVNIKLPDSMPAGTSKLVIRQASSQAEVNISVAAAQQ